MKSSLIVLYLKVIYLFSLTGFNIFSFFWIKKNWDILKISLWCGLGVDYLLFILFVISWASQFSGRLSVIYFSVPRKCQLLTLQILSHSFSLSCLPEFQLNFSVILSISLCLRTAFWIISSDLSSGTIILTSALSNLVLSLPLHF